MYYLSPLIPKKTLAIIKKGERNIFSDIIINLNEIKILEIQKF